MQILISKHPVVCGGGRIAADYRKSLEALAGQWVEVETEHLFADQYNTQHLRVMGSNVTKVKDDTRLGKMKCYCGLTQPIQNHCVKGCSLLHPTLKIFPQNKEVKRFIIRSESERGFWNNEHGWVGAAVNASRFTLKTLRRSHLPMADSVDVLPFKGFSKLSYED